VNNVKRFLERNFRVSQPSWKLFIILIASRSVACPFSARPGTLPRCYPTDPRANIRVQVFDEDQMCVPTHISRERKREREKKKTNKIDYFI